MKSITKNNEACGQHWNYNRHNEYFVSYPHECVVLELEKNICVYSRPIVHLIMMKKKKFNIYSETRTRISQ